MWEKKFCMLSPAIKYKVFDPGQKQNNNLAFPAKETVLKPKYTETGDWDRIDWPRERLFWNIKVGYQGLEQTEKNKFS